ncbi:calcium-activated potassium channel subunit beta-4-like [Glandiceps talaboti]
MAGRKSKKREREPACSCSRLAPRLLITWMFLSLITLGFLAWFIVKPAMQDKSFKQSNCTVAKVQYRSEWQGCRCGRYCWSQFPCLQIFVKYSVNSKYGHTGTGLAHEDETNLNTYPQCTYDVCSGMEYNNEDLVSKFATQYGAKGKIFPCYYNPDQPDIVLIKELFNNKAILHAILWPLLSLFLSIVVAIVVYKKYYKKKKANVKASNNATYKRFSDPVPL